MIGAASTGGSEQAAGVGFPHPKNQMQSEKRKNGATPAPLVCSTTPQHRRECSRWKLSLKGRPLETSFVVPFTLLEERLDK